MINIPETLIWGLIPRFVSLFYCVSFLSLIWQVLPWIGSKGISPIKVRLNALRKYYPGFYRFFYKPTLFWIGDSDRFIILVTCVGIIASVVGIFGGKFSGLAFFTAWICYLSLSDAALIYPWDCLLFEAGFLVLFSPHIALLPNIYSTQAVLPLVSFAWKLLLLRVVWGFAKEKFIGGTKNNFLYLKGFFVWMPLPTPLGLVLYYAPRPILVSLYIFMFAAEVIVPFSAFSSNSSWITVVGLVALMLGIWATGNWGFFNLFYACLCLIFLDNSSLNKLLSERISDNLITNITMLVLIIGGMFYMLGNSWTTRCIMFLISDDEKKPQKFFLNILLKLYRFLVPFRVLHAYGVFPADSIPPIRHAVVFEGSVDGKNWRPYEYRYAPIHEYSAPKFIAPHHPRLDHLISYVSFGVTFSDFFTAPIPYVPYNDFLGCSSYSWVHLIIQRLLENNSSVLSLFKNNPFVNHPPTYVRVATYFLTPVPWQERLKTKRYWKKEFAAVVIAPQTSNLSIWEHHVPPVELLHPMQGYWKKRAPNLVSMLKSAQNPKLLKNAVLVDHEINPQQVSDFWERFVPFVRTNSSGTWEQLPQKATEFQEIFSHNERHLFDRILARYVYILSNKFEREFYSHISSRKSQPSKYYFELLLQDFILDGYKEFEKINNNNFTAILNKLELKPKSSLVYCLALRKFEEVHMFAIFMGAFQWIKNTDKTIDPLFDCLLEQPIFSDNLLLPKLDHGQNSVLTDIYS